MSVQRLLVASAACFAMAACTHHETASAPSRAPGSSSDGGALYFQHCASCHGGDGKGMVGVFPPLAGDPATIGDARTAIAAIALGERKRIVVDGTKYDGVMPGWSADLDDAHLAAIVTFVRGSFHNHAQPVSAADVAAVTGR